MRVPDDPTPPIARRAMVAVRIVTVGALIVCLGIVTAMVLGIGLPYDSLLDAQWMPWSDEPLPPMPGVVSPYPIPYHGWGNESPWGRPLESWLREVVYGSVVLLGLGTIALERRRDSRTEPLALVAAVLTVGAAYWAARVTYSEAGGRMWCTPPYTTLRAAPAGLRPAVVAYVLAMILSTVGLVRCLRSPARRGLTLGSCTLGSAAWSLLLIVMVFFTNDHVLRAGGRNVATLPSAVNARPATAGAEAGLRITVESDLSVTLEVHPMLDPEDPARSRTLWKGKVDDIALEAALVEALDDPLAIWTVESPTDAGTTLAVDANVALGDLGPLLNSLVDAGFTWIRPEAAPRTGGGVRHFLYRTYIRRGATPPTEGAEIVPIDLWTPPSTRAAAPATTGDRRHADFGAAYDTLEVGDDGEPWIDLHTEPGVPWRSIVHARDRAQTVLTLVL